MGSNRHIIEFLPVKNANVSSYFYPKNASPFLNPQKQIETRKVFGNLFSEALYSFWGSDQIGMLV